MPKLVDEQSNVQNEVLREFGRYLSTDEGRRHLEEHEKRAERAREWLISEQAIDALDAQKVVELLKDTDSYAADMAVKGVLKKGLGDDELLKIKHWFKQLLAYDGQGRLPTVEIGSSEHRHTLSVGWASEILTMRFPERFWLINNAAINGLLKLGQTNLPKRTPQAYPEWKPIFDELRQKINPIVQQVLGREATFYDLDLFLWWVVKGQKIEPSQAKGLSEYFKARGFHFTDEQIATFYAALKMKGFVILSGLSGTGKTKLAQFFAELICPCQKCHGDESNGETKCRCTHLFLSVRPDWRDSKALLGYYNPLIERYESTPLLEFLLRAAKEYREKGKEALPYFVILDEMNLSHVEYYFADFLSVLESGRDENGWTKEPLRLYPPDLEKRSKIEQEQNIPPELRLPPNLYIIGTVNIDETTYMFSPKVLDRAFTIEFRDVDFSNYPSPEIGDAQQIADQIRDAILSDLRNGGKFCAVAADKGEIKRAIKEELSDAKQQLEELNRRLQPYDLHFGYRVLDEIALFIRYAKSLSEEVGKALSADDALDHAALMKVLPKFHGPRQKLEMPLWYVVDWCLKQEQKQGEQQGTGEQFSPQSVWKHIKEDRVPSHADIATLLRDWGNHANKFRYPATARKALQMLRQLYETGFASFAQ